MKLSEKLKKLREEMKMTQKDVASMVGVSERVYSYYEQDDRFPKDKETLQSLAKAFNLTVSELLDEKQTEIPGEFRLLARGSEQLGPAEQSALLAFFQQTLDSFLKMKQGNGNDKNNET